MGQTTDIEWCDSSQNPVWGCDGCELWAPDKGVKTCYAGRIAESPRFGGAEGDFKKVEFHPDRVAKALKWRDLTGTVRDSKPWLDGLPRTIFWNDMSDSFTNSAWKRSPFWLDVVARDMDRSPHIHQILTKRPSNMVKWWNHLAASPRIDRWWFGTSVTSPATAKRARTLVDKRHLVNGVKIFVSVEPVNEYVDLRPWLDRVDWLIWGGQSGPGAPPADLGAARRTLADCREHGTAFFMKQLGTALDPGRGKGGRLDLMPEDLRVREMPLRARVQEQRQLFAA